MQTFSEWQREQREAQEEGLRKLYATYGPDYMAWPCDNRDPQVRTVHMDDINFQRKVLLDGVKLGWVSRLGGYDGPVYWNAYWDVPGEVKGQDVTDDGSKLRYAVQDLIYEACKRARRLVEGPQKWGN